MEFTFSENALDVDTADPRAIMRVDFFKTSGKYYTTMPIAVSPAPSYSGEHWSTLMSQAREYVRKLRWCRGMAAVVSFSDSTDLPPFMISADDRL